MGFSYRKRVRTGKRSWLNISKRGISGSGRAGPFTINSRGRTSFRLGRGLSYRGGCASVMVFVVGASTALTVLISRV
jgi:hypothetical protein